MRSTLIGVVLIEFMLALVLGLLLLVIASNLYLSMQKSMTLQTSLYMVDMNARLAIDILATDIQKAGYAGCMRFTNGLTIIGPDAINVKYADYPYARLIKNLGQIVYVSKDFLFKVNDYLIAADCKHNEFLRVSSVSDEGDLQKLILTKPLSNTFDGYTEVARLINHTYYLAYTSRKDIQGKLIRALYMRDIQVAELVAGIDDLKVSQNHGVNIDLVTRYGKISREWHAYVSI